MSDGRFVVPPVPNLTAVMAETRRLDQERQAKISGRYDATLVFEHLMQRVEEFQKGLKEDKEVGLQLANYGLAAELHIRSIGFQNPNLLEFTGLTADGNECVLIQHISQLNFMLKAVKPMEDKPFRVGFGQ